MKRNLAKSWPARFVCKGLFGAAVLFFAVVGSSTAPGQEEISFDKGAVFDEVFSIVDRDFFDSKFNGVDWPAAGKKFRERALAAKSEAEFTSHVREMLAMLRTSHTAYFPVSDPKRYQIAGVFGAVLGDDLAALCEFDGVGIDTVIVDGKTWVQSVFDGHPAHGAGILAGDEIVSVDDKPFRAIESFRGKAGQQARFLVRRTADAEPVGVSVTVERLDGQTMFEKALEASVRVIEREGRRIGYVHVWSYAGAKYHEQLKSILFWGKLKDCDALVLDLRDGWGGASLEYVNLFREPIAELRSETRNGESSNFSGVWGKPVCLLINGRSTSGKELFTYAFRKLGLGPVVGETTAGAVVAGSVRRLSNDAILYVAVSDIRVDGVRLEGIGVEPTHKVERPVPYSAGADPQLAKSLELMQQTLAERR